MCTSTRSHGLIHHSAVFSSTIWWWSAHIVTAWGTWPPSVCVHISSGSRSSSVSWDTQYRQLLREKPATSILQMPLRAFISIVITSYLLVHAPAAPFSTRWLTFLTPVVSAKLAKDTYVTRVHITTVLSYWAWTPGSPPGKPWNVCLLHRFYQ